MSDRLHPRTCLAIITGLAVLFWIPAAYFLAYVADHLPKGIAL